MKRIQRAYPSSKRHPRWFSFGIHVDLSKMYCDIHFIWWLITFGKQQRVLDIYESEQWEELYNRQQQEVQEFLRNHNIDLPFETQRQSEKEF